MSAVGLAGDEPVLARTLGEGHGDGDGPRRLRVLCSAFSCGPGLGSEPGAGWLWALAAARRHDVWLLTNEVHRDAIEAARGDAGCESMQVVYVPQPAWLPGGQTDLRALRLRYLFWQRAARRTAEALHRDVGFDVGHHITLSSDWMPAGIAGLQDVPIVWGPVGGYSRPAWSLARWFGLRWVAGEVVRRVGTGALRTVATRWTLPRVALVAAQNGDVAGRLRRIAPAEVVVEQNIALDDPLLATVAAAPRPAPGDGVRCEGRALFAGRLVAWKGAALAVAALARAPLAHWTLDIVGDGPDRARIEQQIERLGLGGRVTVHGMLERAEVLAAMASADVLVLPSANDSAGWVVAEAAAVGCPVVCLDRAGPAQLAGEGCGVAVAVGGDLPGALAAAIASVRRLDPPLRRWSVDRLPSVVDGWYRAAVVARAR